MTIPRRLAPEAYAAGVLAGDRALLAKTVTLVESNRDDDRRLAQDVLARLLPHTGGAHRIAISGPPGAGKSTLIEVLGMRLLNAGHRVAVLAIDPSSSVTGGSILGDKTRMTELGADARAFVRPSPSGGALGGVHRKTRETMLLCEAAGFDVVLVETVGVGQSEITVAEMVDTFLLLLLPGAGDEVQGIKKGILEVADVVCVTKADGDHAALAALSAQQLSSALRLLRPASPTWRPPVLSCSAVTDDGLTVLWETLQRHRAVMAADGQLDARRARQRQRWMWSIVEDTVLRGIHTHPGVAAILPRLAAAVEAGTEPATRAAEEILAALRDGSGQGGAVQVSPQQATMTTEGR